MTLPLMKSILAGRDTLHELDQPLKELALCVQPLGSTAGFTDI